LLQTRLREFFTFLSFSPVHFEEALAMASRRPLVLLLVGIFPAMGASYRTTNFIVQAATPQLAKQFGDAAEYYRKEKAMLWLGQEMAAWPQPCPLTVKVTMGGPGGATSFVFDQGRVLRQNMEIEGPLDRLLASVLPHEITHTVFAYYFRRPVPRWADEGGSVLSEDDPERIRHDKLVRQILNEGRAIPLRRLFTLRDYPREVMCLYAEGFSMANFLVNSSNRQTYLRFVAQGMSQGWDGAVRTYYRYNSVEELEQAWLAELRRTKGTPAAAMLASNRPTTRQPAPAQTTGRTVVRLTAPPIQPLDEGTRPPVYRGQSGGSDEGEGRFGDERRPRYLPEYNRSSPAQPPVQPRTASPTGWQPARSEPYVPVQVQLGSPEFGPAPPPPNGRPVPNSVSPVGYPQ
jgi:hypothetical protein